MTTPPPLSPDTETPAVEVSGMKICEYQFVMVDVNNLRYSRAEVDIYAWIPASFRQQEQNHRLSLRKNIITNQFELYKYYRQTGTKEVVFHSASLQEAVDQENQLWNHYHGARLENYRHEDTVCTHPKYDSWCYKTKLDDIYYMSIDQIVELVMTGKEIPIDIGFRIKNPADFPILLQRVMPYLRNAHQLFAGLSRRFKLDREWTLLL